MSVFTDTPKHEVSYGLLVDKTGATDLDLTDRSHETVLGEDVVVGKEKIGIVSKLDADSQWRVKDITQLKTFLDYLKGFSKIPVKLTKKFEGDLEGKINAELKNGQARAQDLKKNILTKYTPLEKTSEFYSLAKDVPLDIVGDPKKLLRDVEKIEKRDAR